MLWIVGGGVDLFEAVLDDDGGDNDAVVVVVVGTLVTTHGGILFSE